MITASIDRDAQMVWDYMCLHQEPVKSDAVFCLCSHDTRVAVRAAELMNQGFGKYLIISGGAGRLTKDIFNEPEAEIFKKITLEHGVDPSKIIIEPKSTNTGENIRFTYRLLAERNIKVSSFVLVQKPYMERRTFATFKKQWPDPTTAISVTSPQLTYEKYVSSGISKEDVINIMVGDLQRIKEYPKLGFQIAQDIPVAIWEAYERLVDTGFNKHLLH